MQEKKKEIEARKEKREGQTQASSTTRRHIPSVYTLSIRFRLTAGRLEHA